MFILFKIVPVLFYLINKGYHIKIKHAGGLKLKPIQQMLEKMLEMGKLDNGVRFHVSRYHMNGAHAIIVPMKNNTDASTRMLSEILSRIRSGKNCFRLKKACSKIKMMI
jgi:hypothetical protein